ncbi:unnamed protein product [Hymenolepis diminuta]|uniref:Uncharacterized protein n=1 Tax=Hymenolepis diminuta TaxID=6216 RepID=A0A564XVM6_HYMDI|nr:unnamed protein product [Hymenolepis diminuta]
MSIQSDLRRLISRSATQNKLAGVFPLKVTSHFIHPESCTASPEVLDALKATISSSGLARVFQASSEIMVISNTMSTCHSRNILLMQMI